MLCYKDPEEENDSQNMKMENPEEYMILYND